MFSVCITSLAFKLSFLSTPFLYGTTAQMFKQNKLNYFLNDNIFLYFMYNLNVLF